MAVSDQLFDLANRAKKAEDKVAAARGKARTELEADVKAAQASASKRAEALKMTMDAQRGKLSTSWEHARSGLNETIATNKEKMQARKAEHDVKRAAHHADRAESDATFAIDFAYMAVEQAESEVLDAILARKNADELAGAKVHA